MDATTLKAYSDNADRLIKSYTTMKPRRLYELIATFFHRSARTLGVGCGSGRDLAFLQGSGFKIEGLDNEVPREPHYQHMLKSPKVILTFPISHQIILGNLNRKSIRAYHFLK